MAEVTTSSRDCRPATIPRGEGPFPMDPPNGDRGDTAPGPRDTSHTVPVDGEKSNPAAVDVPKSDAAPPEGPFSADDRHGGVPVPFAFQEFETERAGESNRESEGDGPAVQDVVVRIVVGRTRLNATEAADLATERTVLLDEALAEPVEVHANGRLIARGELLVLDGRFCVRVTESVRSEQNDPLLVSTGSPANFTESSG